MPKGMLYVARGHAIVGQLEAGRVAEHMRVDRKGQLSSLTRALDHLQHTIAG